MRQDLRPYSHLPRIESYMRFVEGLPGPSGTWLLGVPAAYTLAVV